ncbi:hypothetical protein AB0H83_29370 [Dactylosporangium sp. NPDC050688]|uniref:hypothetical protein n=1 Tax=Dactylosporangium sp. NPDC050688 TaxID=3157217 RepID=UPI0033F336B7
MHDSYRFRLRRLTSSAIAATIRMAMTEMIHPAMSMKSPSDRSGLQPGSIPGRRRGKHDLPGREIVFALDRGDIAAGPPSGNRFPTMYHAVAKGTPYSWPNRYWYIGSAVWWGGVTYRRANVPGATTDTGFGLKFFE